MGQQTKNSHYISRVVTKAWEDDRRRLHYFDLETERLDSAPSKTLFVQDDPLEQATEDLLSRRIEDSIGKYLKACEKAGGVLADVNGDDRVVRALFGLVALQAARTHQALAPMTSRFKVEELVADDALLDQLVNDFQRLFVLVGGTLRRGEWMAFPSAGTFAIPVLDYPPALAMPLTPNTFVALIEKDANTDHILQMIRTPSQIAAFSMIGEGLEHKLVIPAPYVVHRNAEQRVEFEGLLKNMRAKGRELFNLIGKMALTAGLRAWHYDGRPRSRTPAPSTT